jgi:integrase
MATIYQPIAVKPIPPVAEIRIVDGARYARWKNRKGELTVAKVTDCGRRCRVVSPVYWVQWFDDTGRHRERVGTKEQAELRAASIIRQVARNRIHQELGLPTESSPRSEIETLHTLASEYRDYLLAMGRTDVHAGQVHSQIKAVATECNWARPLDVTVASWSKWVAKQRKADLSVETCNHYLRSLRAMFRWLIRSGRIQANPLASVDTINPIIDRRVTRRTLSPEDLAKLLKITQESKRIRLELSGRDRSILYLLAARTGLRAGTLANLCAGDLHLSAKVPFVRVDGRNVKNRKSIEIPLSEATVKVVKPWLAGRKKEDRLWPSSWRDNCRGADMLRDDLKEAGIPYKTSEGTFDFHAFRSQCGTDLANAGVPLTVAQKILGHSTPTLTAKYYSRHNLENLKDAIDKLG